MKTLVRKIESLPQSRYLGWWPIDYRALEFPTRTRTLNFGSEKTFTPIKIGILLGKLFQFKKLHCTFTGLKSCIHLNY